MKKQMISTSKQIAEHGLAGRNTQQILRFNAQVKLLCQKYIWPMKCSELLINLNCPILISLSLSFFLVLQLHVTQQVFRMAAPPANPIAEPPVFVNYIGLPKPFYKNIIESLQ